MGGLGSGPGPGLCFLTLILFLSPQTQSAPVQEDGPTPKSRIQGFYDGSSSEISSGCYYNFQHYDEGDRIITNEPCLNCTCHNRMLMCYLRVCPFTKAIGQNCTIERKPGQCCPLINCPEVPVQLLTSSTTTEHSESPHRNQIGYGQYSSAIGHPDDYGCQINGEFYTNGAQIPGNIEKPCEVCYCIRNRTACIMQECTLQVEGCIPVYEEGLCCPVRYQCDYEYSYNAITTEQPRPTPGLILTTTTSGPFECQHDGKWYGDGSSVDTEDPCEHCYCMKGDIVCAVQECKTPFEKDGHNCTAMPPTPGKCCPDSYHCDGNDIEDESEPTFRQDRTHKFHSRYENNANITMSMTSSTTSTSGAGHVVGKPSNENEIPNRFTDEHDKDGTIISKEPGTSDDMVDLEDGGMVVTQGMPPSAGPLESESHHMEGASTGHQGGSSLSDEIHFNRPNLHNIYFGADGSAQGSQAGTSKPAGQGHGSETDNILTISQVIQSIIQNQTNLFNQNMLNFTFPGGAGNAMAGQTSTAFGQQGQGVHVAGSETGGKRKPGTQLETSGGSSLAGAGHGMGISSSVHGKPTGEGGLLIDEDGNPLEDHEGVTEFPEEHYGFTSGPHTFYGEHGTAGHGGRPQTSPEISQRPGAEVSMTGDDSAQAALGHSGRPVGGALDIFGEHGHAGRPHKRPQKPPSGIYAGGDEGHMTEIYDAVTEYQEGFSGKPGEFVTELYGESGHTGRPHKRPSVGGGAASTGEVESATKLPMGVSDGMHIIHGEHGHPSESPGSESITKVTDEIAGAQHEETGGPTEGPGSVSHPVKQQTTVGDQGSQSMDNEDSNQVVTESTPGHTGYYDGAFIHAPHGEYGRPQKRPGTGQTDESDRPTEIYDAVTELPGYTDESEVEHGPSSKKPFVHQKPGEVLTDGEGKPTGTYDQEIHSVRPGVPIIMDSEHGQDHKESDVSHTVAHQGVTETFEVTSEGSTLPTMFGEHGRPQKRPTVHKQPESDGIGRPTETYDATTEYLESGSTGTPGDHALVDGSSRPQEIPHTDEVPTKDEEGVHTSSPMQGQYHGLSDHTGRPHEQTVVHKTPDLDEGAVTEMHQITGHPQMQPGQHHMDKGTEEDSGMMGEGYDHPSKVDDFQQKPLVPGKPGVVPATGDDKPYGTTELPGYAERPEGSTDFYGESGRPQKRPVVHEMPSMKPGAEVGETESPEHVFGSDGSYSGRPTRPGAPSEEGLTESPEKDNAVLTDMGEQRPEVESHEKPVVHATPETHGSPAVTEEAVPEVDQGMTEFPDGHSAQPGSSTGHTIYDDHGHPHMRPGIHTRPGSGDGEQPTDGVTESSYTQTVLPAADNFYGEHGRPHKKPVIHKIPGTVEEDGMPTEAYDTVTDTVYGQSTRPASEGLDMAVGGEQKRPGAEGSESTSESGSQTESAEGYTEQPEGSTVHTMFGESGRPHKRPVVQKKPVADVGEVLTEEDGDMDATGSPENFTDGLFAITGRPHKKPVIEKQPGTDETTHDLTTDSAISSGSHVEHEEQGGPHERPIQHGHPMSSGSVEYHAGTEIPEGYPTTYPEPSRPQKKPVMTPDEVSEMGHEEDITETSSPEHLTGKPDDTFEILYDKFGRPYRKPITKPSDSVPEVEHSTGGPEEPSAIFGEGGHAGRPQKRPGMEPESDVFTTEGGENLIGMPQHVSYDDDEKPNRRPVGSASPAEQEASITTKEPVTGDVHLPHEKPESDEHLPTEETSGISETSTEKKPEHHLVHETYDENVSGVRPESDLDGGVVDEKNDGLGSLKPDVGEPVEMETHKRPGSESAEVKPTGDTVEKPAVHEIFGEPGHTGRPHKKPEFQPSTDAESQTDITNAPGEESTKRPEHEETIDIYGEHGHLGRPKKPTKMPGSEHAEEEMGTTEPISFDYTTHGTVAHKQPVIGDDTAPHGTSPESDDANEIEVVGTDQRPEDVSGTKPDLGSTFDATTTEYSTGKPEFDGTLSIFGEHGHEGRPQSKPTRPATAGHLDEEPLGEHIPQKPSEPVEGDLPTGQHLPPVEPATSDELDQKPHHETATKVSDDSSKPASGSHVKPTSDEAGFTTALPEGDGLDVTKRPIKKPVRPSLDGLTVSDEYEEMHVITEVPAIYGEHGHLGRPHKRPMVHGKPTSVHDTSFDGMKVPDENLPSSTGFSDQPTITPSADASEPLMTTTESQTEHGDTNASPSQENKPLTGDTVEGKPAEESSGYPSVTSEYSGLDSDGQQTLSGGMVPGAPSTPIPMGPVGLFDLGGVGEVGKPHVDGLPTGSTPGLLDHSEISPTTPGHIPEAVTGAAESGGSKPQYDTTEIHGQPDLSASVETTFTTNAATYTDSEGIKHQPTPIPDGHTPVTPQDQSTIVSDATPAQLGISGMSTSIPEADRDGQTQKPLHEIAGSTSADGQGSSTPASDGTAPELNLDESGKPTGTSGVEFTTEQSSLSQELTTGISESGQASVPGHEDGKPETSSGKQPLGSDDVPLKLPDGPEGSQQPTAVDESEPEGDIPGKVSGIVGQTADEIVPVESLKPAQHLPTDEQEGSSPSTELPVLMDKVSSTKPLDESLDTTGNLVHTGQTTEESAELTGTTEHPSAYGEVPGEGSCFIDGTTYKNNSDVPPLSPCKKKCTCINSVIHCIPLECPPPPIDLSHCTAVSDKDSCCPIYTCGSDAPPMFPVENQEGGISTDATVDKFTMGPGGQQSISTVQQEDSKKPVLVDQPEDEYKPPIVVNELFPTMPSADSGTIEPEVHTGTEKSPHLPTAKPEHVASVSEESPSVIVTDGTKPHDAQTDSEDVSKPGETASDKPIDEYQDSHKPHEEGQPPVEVQSTEKISGGDVEPEVEEATSGTAEAEEGTKYPEKPDGSMMETTQEGTKPEGELPDKPNEEHSQLSTDRPHLSESETSAPEIQFETPTKDEMAVEDLLHEKTQTEGHKPNEDATEKITVSSDKETESPFTQSSPGFGYLPSSGGSGALPTYFGTSKPIVGSDDSKPPAADHLKPEEHIPSTVHGSSNHTDDQPQFPVHYGTDGQGFTPGSSLHDLEKPTEAVSDIGPQPDGLPASQKPEDAELIKPTTYSPSHEPKEPVGSHVESSQGVQKPIEAEPEDENLVTPKPEVYYPEEMQEYSTEGSDKKKPQFEQDIMPTVKPDGGLDQSGVSQADVQTEQSTHPEKPHAGISSTENQFEGSVEPESGSQTSRPDYDFNKLNETIEKVEDHSSQEPVQTHQEQPTTMPSLSADTEPSHISTGISEDTIPKQPVHNETGPLQEGLKPGQYDILVDHVSGTEKPDDGTPGHDTSSIDNVPEEETSGKPEYDSTGTHHPLEVETSERPEGGTVVYQQPGAGTSEKPDEEGSTIHHGPEMETPEKPEYDETGVHHRPDAETSEKPQDQTGEYHRPEGESSEKPEQDGTGVPHQPGAVTSEKPGDLEIPEKPEDQTGVHHRPEMETSEKPLDEIDLHHRPEEETSEKPQDQTGIHHLPEMESSQKPEIESSEKPEFDETGVPHRPEPGTSEKPLDEIDVHHRPEEETSEKPEDQTGTQHLPEMESSQKPEIESSEKPEFDETGVHHRPEEETSEKPEDQTVVHHRPEMETSEKPEMESSERPEFDETGVHHRPDAETSEKPQDQTGEYHRPEGESSGKPEYDGSGVPHQPGAVTSEKPGDLEIPERPEEGTADHHQPGEVTSERPPDEAAGHQRPEAEASEKPLDEIDVHHRPEEETSEKPQDQIGDHHRPGAETSEKPEFDGTGVHHQPEAGTSEKPLDEIDVHHRPEEEISEKPEDQTGVHHRPGAETSEKPEDQTGVHHRPDAEISEKPEDATVDLGPEMETSDKPEYDGIGHQRPEVESSKKPEIDETSFQQRPETEITAKPEESVPDTHHEHPEIGGQPEVAQKPSVTSDAPIIFPDSEYTSKPQLMLGEHGGTMKPDYGDFLPGTLIYQKPISEHPVKPLQSGAHQKPEEPDLVTELLFTQTESAATSPTEFPNVNQQAPEQIFNGTHHIQYVPFNNEEEPNVPEGATLGQPQKGPDGQIYWPIIYDESVSGPDVTTQYPQSTQKPIAIESFNGTHFIQYVPYNDGKEPEVPQGAELGKPEEGPDGQMYWPIVTLNPATPVTDEDQMSTMTPQMTLQMKPVPTKHFNGSHYIQYVPYEDGKEPIIPEGAKLGKPEKRPDGQFYWPIIYLTPLSSAPQEDTFTTPRPLSHTIQAFNGTHYIQYVPYEEDKAPEVPEGATLGKPQKGPGGQIFWPIIYSRPIGPMFGLDRPSATTQQPPTPEPVKASNGTHIVHYIPYDPNHKPEVPDGGILGEPQRGPGGEMYWPIVYEKPMLFIPEEQSEKIQSFNGTHFIQYVPYEEGKEPEIPDGATLGEPQKGPGGQIYQPIIYGQSPISEDHLSATTQSPDKPHPVQAFNGTHYIQYLPYEDGRKPEVPEGAVLGKPQKGPGGQMYWPVIYSRPLLSGGDKPVSTPTQSRPRPMFVFNGTHFIQYVPFDDDKQPDVPEGAVLGEPQKGPDGQKYWPIISAKQPPVTTEAGEIMPMQPDYDIPIHQQKPIFNGTHYIQYVPYEDQKPQVPEGATLGEPVNGPNGQKYWPIISTKPLQLTPDQQGIPGYGQYQPVEAPAFNGTHYIQYVPYKPGMRPILPEGASLGKPEKRPNGQMYWPIIFAKQPSVTTEAGEIMPMQPDHNIPIQQQKPLFNGTHYIQYVPYEDQKPQVPEGATLGEPVDGPNGQKYWPIISTKPLQLTPDQQGIPGYGQYQPVEAPVFNGTHYIQYVPYKPGMRPILPEGASLGKPEKRPNGQMYWPIIYLRPPVTVQQTPAGLPQDYSKPQQQQVFNGTHYIQYLPYDPNQMPQVPEGATLGQPQKGPQGQTYWVLISKKPLPALTYNGTHFVQYVTPVSPTETPLTPQQISQEPIFNGTHYIQYLPASESGLEPEIPEGAILGRPTQGPGGNLYWPVIYVKPPTTPKPSYWVPGADRPASQLGQVFNGSHFILYLPYDADKMPEIPEGATLLEQPQKGPDGKKYWVIISEKPLQMPGSAPQQAPGHSYPGQVYNGTHFIYYILYNPYQMPQVPSEAILGQPEKGPDGQLYWVIISEKPIPPQTDTPLVQYVTPASPAEIKPTVIIFNGTHYIQYIPYRPDYKPEVPEGAILGEPEKGAGGIMYWPIIYAKPPKDFAFNGTASSEGGKPQLPYQYQPGTFFNGTHIVLPGPQPGALPTTEEYKKPIFNGTHYIQYVPYNGTAMPNDFLLPMLQKPIHLNEGQPLPPGAVSNGTHILVPYNGSAVPDLVQQKPYQNGSESESQKPGGQVPSSWAYGQQKPSQQNATRLPGYHEGSSGYGGAYPKPDYETGTGGAGYYKPDRPSHGPEDSTYETGDEDHMIEYPSGSDYDETPEQPYGQGTCRYAGKVYVSAQQIPRDDPCDFCFCFRSDIICLQQSCPPPIPGCHEEPIQGFCCPRYECHVRMATLLNVTSTTTTTTTTLPPHFLSHVYKGAAGRTGCFVQGKAYRVGQPIPSASGPCMDCLCGGDGKMKCEPKVCTPEPMIRQMMVSSEKPISANRK